MINYSQMIGLHMSRCSHICMSKYSGKWWRVKGQPKMRSQNLMGNVPSGTKFVWYERSHFVWSDWSDMTMLRTKNAASNQCTFLLILVINPNHFLCFPCSELCYEDVKTWLSSVSHASYLLRSMNERKWILMCKQEHVRKIWRWAEEEVSIRI